MDTTNMNDDQYVQAIFKMNTCELLNEILHNPEYLTDPPYGKFRAAMVERAKRLGIHAD